ncbi:thioredoxin-like protein [Pisolithus croceorrhizus]|nr:thioredoxin-like protein [Pisolithus croceorrhizus]
MPISYHCTLPRVNTSSEFTIRVPGVTIPNARFPFKIGPTGHQGAIEDAFLDSLAQHNLTVTLARLDAATNADDLKVIHAEYVVGADERTKYTQDLIDFDKRYAALFSGKPRTSADQNGISHEEFFKAYKTAGGFTSGTGIHYGPSMIVNAKHQSCAQNFVVEQRMLSQVFLHAANVRPVRIHDLLPANARFKILIFLGSIGKESRLAQINVLADELSSPTGPLKRYSMDGQTPSPMFDLITIVEGNKENFNHLNVPLVSQPHWSKDLLNDTDVAGSEGGGGYERFGISSELVALVLVRLDGYIGMVAPAAALQDVHEHFALFLLPCH